MYDGLHEQNMRRTVYLEPGTFRWCWALTAVAVAVAAVLAWIL